MPATMNRCVLLKHRPVGEPRPSDFEIVDAPMPTPGDGDVLVRTIWLSLDPYMRGRMNDVKSYATPVPLGGVMTGGTVGEAMAAGTRTVPPDLAFDQALAALRESGLPALPVVDGSGTIVGLLTLDNLTDVLLVRRARPDGGAEEGDA